MKESRADPQDYTTATVCEIVLSNLGDIATAGLPEDIFGIKPLVPTAMS